MDLMTADDVAHMLKLNRNTIYQLKANNEIPFIKIGSSVRFVRADIEKWIADKSKK